MKDKPDMLQTSRRLSVRVLVLVALFVATQAFAQLPVTDLGTLGSIENGSAAIDINDRGEVAGVGSGESFADHAFFWSLDKGMIDLGTLGEADNSVAFAINDLGQIVGESGHAFLWTEGAGMIDLGTLGGPSSVATDINNLGQVAGVSKRADNLFVVNPFFWSEATGMLEIGPPFRFLSVPWVIPQAAINDLGQVAFSGWVTDAFLWSQEGGLVQIGTGIAVYDLNNRGQVVGSNSSGPFLWSEAEGMRALGTPEVLDGAATAINDNGRVVGYVRTEALQILPFIWSEEGGMIILESLLGGDSYAFDINELGVVAGLSDSADNRRGHTFLWTEEGGMVDGGTLGGPYATCPITINNLGQMVGHSNLATVVTSHATLWGETRIADLWLEQRARRVSARNVRLTLTVHSAPGCRAAEPEVCGFGATVDAENVVLIDHLPLDPTRIEVVSMPSACGYDQGSHTVTCQAALLPRDSSVSVAIEARYTGAGGDLADAVNSATVSSDTFDSNPDNNTVTLPRSGS